MKKFKKEIKMDKFREERIEYKTIKYGNKIKEIKPRIKKESTTRKF